MPELRTSASRISMCRLAYSLTVHSTLLAIASKFPIILIGNQIADLARIGSGSTWEPTTRSGAGSARLRLDANDLVRDRTSST